MILSGGAKKNMGAVAAAKLEFTRRLLFTGFVLVLACFAGFSYISQAWFASNKDVGAENASVTSESGTPNLFIRMQADPSASFYSSVSTNWSIADSSGKGLYPISTANCTDWYYISNWTMEYSSEDPVTGITTGEYYASGYTKASPNADGIYTGYAGQTRRAYYCSQYNLYSDKGELDVYLNPNNPIEVTFDEANQGLMKAIRVAVVGPDGLKFVYAPEAETGAGKNFIGGLDAEGKPNVAAPGIFYAVTGPNTAEVQTILVGSDGLANYKGVQEENDPHSFKAGENSISICRAGVTGANVSVYIWLEGMDAQSIINVADNRTIGVKLNFVGVPVEAASTQENGTGA